MISLAVPEHLLVWVEVDLDLLEHNARHVVKRVGADQEVLAVVKARAYGHGAIEAARAFRQGGVAWFGVFLLDEVLELRRGGIREPILFMGLLPLDGLTTLLDHGATPTVVNEEGASALNEEARRRGGSVSYHLKVDTGMGRLGVPVAELPSFLGRIRNLHKITMEGVFTHLACAENPDHPLTASQLERFTKAMNVLRSAGYRPSLAHAGNSAGGLRGLGHGLTMIRAGIALYGYSPAPETLPEPSLRPALALRCRIVQVKRVAPGATVGYGATWEAPGESLIATLPLGYEEGYRRDLARGGEVLLRGRRSPIVGRISMDQITIDVSEHGNAQAGESVTLLGEDGTEWIDAWDLARRADTIPWEILCSISPVLPRLYHRSGRIVKLGQEIWRDGAT